MSVTVIDAFNEFMRETVNLAAGVSTDARASRGWLLEQIHKLPERCDDFPTLYTERDVNYGSFDRRTKIRELDDLDMIVGISALGTTYVSNGNAVQLTVPDGITLRGLCHDGTNQLNSRKVINKFVIELAEIPQYEKAEIGRRGVAAILNLKSYTWSFDIVPGFFTTPEYDGRTYYIIPDGDGHWMKTDPRVDHDRVTSINKSHDGNVLDAVRLVKYWNRRPTMPSVPSYPLECMVLNYYANKTAKALAFVDIEFGPILQYLASAVLSTVADPKGIQGDLNTLSWSDRLLVSSRATADAAKASAARLAETEKEFQKSIGIWREVLGASFPKFG